MAKGKKDYFGLGRVVSILLCLFLGPIMGIVARFSEGKNYRRNPASVLRMERFVGY